MRTYNFNQLKQLHSLFQRIYNELDGDRYFTSSEKLENEKNFIYSLVYNDIKSLLSTMDELKQNSPCNDELIKDLNNVIYKIV